MRRFETFSRNDSFMCYIPRFEHYFIFEESPSGSGFVKLDTSADSFPLWIIASNEDLPSAFRGNCIDDTNMGERDLAILEAQIGSGGKTVLESVSGSRAFISLFKLSRRMTGSRMENASIIAEWCKSNGLPTYRRIERTGRKRKLIGFEIDPFIRDLETLIREKEVINGGSGWTGLSIDSIDLRIEADFSKELPEIRRICSNMVDVARTGLFFESLNEMGTPIMYCECGEPFIPEKPRQRLCEKCSSESGRQARLRRRKKSTIGGGNDGKEAR